MRRRLYVILLVGFTVAAPAAAASPRARFHSASSRHRAERALRRAESVIRGRAPAGVEPTPALSEVAARLPALKVSDRRRAFRLLARPVPGKTQSGESAYTAAEHDPPFCSAHYCIHWVATGPDAPPPLSQAIP